ncbi:MAG: glycosyltransferase [Lachnospiraceae bacterium]|nr:glycosyltransferase [Lachnospiraceae bacterium]
MVNEQNAPLVSIWVLMYNNASELDETVDSIISQDYPNAEVVFSDDGSKVKDPAKVERLAEKIRERGYAVKIFFNEENVGTVAHINSVIDRSEGKYFISCCPGERYHTSGTVSAIVNEMEKKKSLMLTSRRIDVYPDRKKKRPTVMLGLALRFCPKALAGYMVRKRNLISGCCTFESRELFEKYGKYDTSYRLLEDYPYVVDLLRNGARIDFMNCVTVEHAMGGVSTGSIHPAVIKDIEHMREVLKADPHGLPQSAVKYLNSVVQPK